MILARFIWIKTKFNIVRGLQISMNIWLAESDQRCSSVGPPDHFYFLRAILEKFYTLLTMIINEWTTKWSLSGLRRSQNYMWSLSWCQISTTCSLLWLGTMTTSESHILENGNNSRISLENSPIFRTGIINIKLSHNKHLNFL